VKLKEILAVLDFTLKLFQTMPAEIEVEGVLPSVAGKLGPGY
jgi:hypothetical protein